MTHDSTDPQQILANMAYLTKDYLPEATWTVDGIFRFEKGIQTISQFLTNLIGIRGFSRMSGSIATLWSLDWFVQERPITHDKYIRILKDCAANDKGITLVFDNPFVTSEELNDNYSLSLIHHLCTHNENKRNAVCVANDKVAEKIHSHFPQIPIFCHPNRLVAEEGKRTAALYNKLASQYLRVTLHPADATRTNIIDGIEKPENFDIVINDPCLRICSLRREHMRLLAEMRRHPYDMDLMRQRANLIARAGCQSIDPGQLHQKASCNLTRQETCTLYDKGFRHFIIQSHQFRNEITLLWDIFQCMFDYSPEISNKAALIASSAMAEFGKPEFKLPSGLRDFKFNILE